MSWSTIDGGSPRRMARRIAPRWRPAACGFPLALLFCLSGLAQAQAQAPLPPLGEVAQSSAGEFHSCALTTAGGVKCWGSNRHGQLGAADPSTAQRDTPVDVVGLGSGVRAIAAGQAHTCALLETGMVQCWGRNSFGQLGDGSTIDRPRPAAIVGAGEALRSIATGDEHTCGVTLAGRALCWGRNDAGQLGDDRTAASATPVEVTGLRAGVTAIAAGRAHGCAVQAGRVQCWGANDSSQLGDGTTIRRRTPGPVDGLDADVDALVAGRAHTCAITRTGALRCWGLNASGQLGDGSTRSSGRAVAVRGLETGARAVAAGFAHTCAIDGAGAVQCWGDDFFGQLGDDGFAPRSVPARVPLHAAATTLAAGFRHTCAVLAGSGEVACWGNNFDGQLGDGAFTGRLVPVAVTGMAAGVERIGTGFQHSCAFGPGRARCWGDGSRGQLGNLSTSPSAVPVDVASLGGDVRQMDGGTFHSCVLTAAGGVKCWGENGSGQLGDGTTVSRGAPADVRGLASGVTSIAAGAFHTCAVAGGAVHCWGSNGAGQLGPAAGSGATEPQIVAGMERGWFAVSAGATHNCALSLAGAVKCWGANDFGELGDDSRRASSEPVDVAGLQSGVIAIASGGTQATGGFNCALLGSGAVMCWGSNVYGQLGDGTTMQRSGPVEVTSLGGGVRSIDVSSFHACAVNVVGALFCWGRNIEGQLGINSTEQKSLPVAVGGLTAGVAQVSAGGGQTCARLDRGAVRCWGANNFGQVGDGTTWGRRAPVRVLLDEASRNVAALTPAADGESRGATSDDAGRYVVFQSRASNLVAGDDNAAADIFRVDRESGVTLRVSLAHSGAATRGDASEPSVSGDGRLVAFVAPDAAVPDVANETPAAQQARAAAQAHGIYLRDVTSASTWRVGAARRGGAGSRPQLSASGNRIAWTGTDAAGEHDNVYSAALALHSDGVFLAPPRCETCFLRDAGGADTALATIGNSRNPALSAAGDVLAWESDAPRFGADAAGPEACAGAAASIWVRRLAPPSPARPVSLPAAGGHCGLQGHAARQPHLDGSGGRLVFESDQPLTPDDGNHVSDIFLWDDAQQALRLISLGDGAVAANGASGAARLSRDGQSVAFVSSATNLDASFADNNGRPDIHVADTQSGGEVRRLSRSSSGGEANQASDRPTLSADGRRVSFDSRAGNLSLDPHDRTQVLQRSNPLKRHVPLRTATWWNPQESGWGLFVFDQGTVLAPAWFTYDDDGEPLWMIGAALPQGDGSYQGELFRFSGRPFNRTAARASDIELSVGRMTLRHEGEQALRFDYTVDGVSQSKHLVPFTYGGRRLACRLSSTLSRASASNYSDVWWGGSLNSGWGLFLTHLDDDVYALWYTYDDDGEPLFLTVVASLQPDGSYAGAVYRQHDGTPWSRIDGQPATSGSTQVGTAVFRFENGERGSFSYSLGERSDSRPISRFQFGLLPSICDTVPASQAGAD